MASQHSYEMVFILHPGLPEEQLAETVEKVKGYVTAGGGEITSAESGAPWGRRKLAYPIKKATEGYYTLLKMNIAATALPEVERNLKLMEGMLRYMIVKP
ncbi:MAG: 30S ribosomal protein S6 [Chloroflexi bacterium]|nr:30S ribosomal protein S6 [Chloroflexota bacterium]